VGSGGIVTLIRNLARDGREWLPSYLDRFTAYGRDQPPTPIGGWVVPRADMDPWQKNVFPLPRGIEPRSSVSHSARSVVSIPTTLSPVDA
jgi:hypothetical protein